MRLNLEMHPGSDSERAEISSAERLDLITKSVATKQNLEMENRFGLQNLLESDCRISSQGYEDVYSEQELKGFSSSVEKLENKFSDQSPTVDTEWKERKSKNKGSQTELAINCLLFKMLGDKYVVARTNEFDDYANGADNLLVDKETGAAICAFDEVYDRDELGSNSKKKQSKVIEIAMAGGTEINFGIKSENGKLLRGKQENLPIFYLGLSKTELDGLLQNMDEDLETVSDFERAIYAKLLRSIAEQFVVLSRQPLRAEVLANLAKFRESFAK